MTPACPSRPYALQADAVRQLTFANWGSPVNRSRKPTEARVRLPAIAGLALACLLLSTVGCGEALDTTYGERSGISGSASVNGTGVFAEMFEAAGHKVTSATQLSPGLSERADVMVWFPNDCQAPSQEVRDWFDRWLWDNPGCTLIYVSRDFDAAAAYWKRVKPNATNQDLPEITRREAQAAADFATMRSALPTTIADWHWLQMDGTLKPRHVTTLEGDWSWLQGIDASKLDIHLNGRVRLPSDPEMREVELLVESSGDPLVWREPWEQSQSFVVANGSFLLNLQLINHEHRKLAGQLIAQVGTNQRVVFLEASGNPDVLEDEPEQAIPTGLELLGIAPFSQILSHLMIVGVIFCCVRYPIFGVPRDDRREQLSDFSEHVAALGELLAQTGDQAFAKARLTQYHQLMRPENKN